MLIRMNCILISMCTIQGKSSDFPCIVHKALNFEVVINAKVYEVHLVSFKAKECYEFLVKFTE